MNPRSVYQVLEETARTYGEAPALRQPSGSGYLTYSWKEYKQAVEEIAAGLRTLGIGRGDVVALNSETRLEFYLADLGIMTNGSIAAAMYPSYPPRDLVKTLAASGARAVFVEDPKTLEALREAEVAHWILMTGEAEGAVTLSALRAMGRAALDLHPGLLPNMVAETRPSDYAILYLTSGATGEPKMALVTHEAIVSNIDMGPAVLPLGPEDSTVAFLPSAHIAQRVVIEFLPLRCGMPVHLRREPHEAAAGHPQGAPHHPAGAAAHVGAHLFHHLHRAAQAPRAPPARPSTARSGWRSPPRATAAKASRSRCTSAAPSRWPTA